MTSDTDTVMAAEPTVLVDGRWRQAAKRYEVGNPATGEVLALADDADADDARAAVDAAARAAATWSAQSPEERSSVLRAAAAAIRADREELALLLSLESGKPLGEAAGELLSGAAA